MTYTEFKQELKERVQQMLGEQVEVFFSVVEKNNQQLKEVMTFREKGINAMPMVHLQDLYQEYQQKEDLDRMVEFVLAVFETKAVVDEKTILGEWETVRKKICMKLINYEWNKSNLGQVPHYRFLDFAAIFQVGLYEDNERRATVTIRDDFLKVWRITVDELIETAMENLKQEGYEIRSMKEVLGEILGMGMEVNAPEDNEEEDAMYVLSNESRCNGAVGILREDLLKEFAEKIQGNFYILPSSTHELILLPDAESVNREDLKKMVKEINDTQVEVEERLADNVYYFDRKTGMVRM